MVNGITKEMHFYSRSRPDGLVKRIDSPRKVLHYFEDREDRLVYRSATCEVSEDESLQRDNLIKMTEKFTWNEEIPPQSDIYKKTYFMKEEKVF
jgi:hypothetical protein